MRAHFMSATVPNNEFSDGVYFANLEIMRYFTHLKQQQLQRQESWLLRDLKSPNKRTMKRKKVTFTFKRDLLSIPNCYLLFNCLTRSEMSIFCCMITVLPRFWNRNCKFGYFSELSKMCIVSDVYCM